MRLSLENKKVLVQNYVNVLNVNKPYTSKTVKMVALTLYTLYHNKNM